MNLEVLNMSRKAKYDNVLSSQSSLLAERCLL